MKLLKSSDSIATSVLPAKGSSAVTACCEFVSSAPAFKLQYNIHQAKNTKKKKNVPPRVKIIRNCRLPELRYLGSDAKELHFG